MSTTDRKARKRAGIRFSKAPKVGTPLAERAWFAGFVLGAVSTRFEGARRSRSEKKRLAALAERGLDIPEWMRREEDEENGEAS